ncbi:Protein spire [Papilio machaon]|uniref:Protein spire n=1 Tax=Papilio machaon TaxID=76193 RepID=A0A194QNN3_PAPMA|nr:Protein spire [Papilio machaon]
MGVCITSTLAMEISHIFKNGTFEVVPIVFRRVHEIAACLQSQTCFERARQCHTSSKLRRSRVSPAALLLGTRPVSGLLEPVRSPEEPALDVAQDKAFWGSVAATMTCNYRTQTSNGASSGPGSVEVRRNGGGGGDVTPHAPPQRRLIKVDFDNLEDDEDEDDTETCISPETCIPQPFPRHTAPQQPAPKPWKRTAYDLATQCPSRRASMRRHTVTHVCPPSDGAQSLPHSRPGSRASCAGAASLASSELDAQLGELSWSRSSLQDELIKSVSGSPSSKHKQWQEAIMSDDRLSLTLEEIVHIRSVLTKAELEFLPSEGRVKEDVEKRRVCFLCLKTRFGIFGPWGQKCKLCKKTVCQKCCSKMRIPTEHFAHVPVVLLSPSLLPSPEDEAPSFPRSLVSRLVSPEHHDNSVGSAPSSPVSRRACPQSAPGSRGGSRGGSALGFADLAVHAPSAMTRSVDGPGSMPCVINDRRSRGGRGSGGASAAERLRGVQMAVCHDCKAMVLQIIKSSRAARSASRDRALRHLTLDLAPVYTDNC